MSRRTKPRRRRVKPVQGHARHAARHDPKLPAAVAREYRNLGIGEILKLDRVRRLMPWPAYAELLGEGESMLKKLASGKRGASEVYEARVRSTLGLAVEVEVDSVSRS